MEMGSADIRDSGKPALRLKDGSRVAVIGGGPAGSFFSHFLLSMAARGGLAIEIDLFEPRDFSLHGHAGCNKCGGIIYESLVQSLATDGIVLPATVVQQGIAGYLFHTDEGIVRIRPPSDERRIASVRRGAGPCGASPRGVSASFDGHLLEMAERKGARIVRERVTGVSMTAEGARVTTEKGRTGRYDLVVGALGVNSPDLAQFPSWWAGYVPPSTTKAYITEILLGSEEIGRCLGDAMHVFVLDLPRLKFAAIIPKGEYATVCLLGTDIDPPLVESFFRHPEVLACFPAGWTPPAGRCRCFPSIILGAAKGAFGDRFVAIGDSSVSRLYKDGIGNAYRTAKAAAQTAFLEGISKKDFGRYYRPVCDAVARDNRFGRVVYAFTGLLQRMPFLRTGMIRMTKSEQAGLAAPRMSGVLWDTFTGNASFRDIFLRTLHPGFLVRLLFESVRGWSLSPNSAVRER
jgi:flavin-dependent dehydrogenase